MCSCGEGNLCYRLFYLLFFSQSEHLFGMGGREAEMYWPLCRAGDKDLKASEKHSTCWAAHKAPIITVWATPFASHWKCCLAHQHKQLKNKRGKTSACLFKMLSKRREAWDLREKGRFVVSKFHAHPPYWNSPIKLLFEKPLKQGGGSTESSFHVCQNVGSLTSI